MTQDEFNKFDKDFEVCSCMGVTLEEIQLAIKNGCDSVEAIMDETDAGTACECCLEADCDKVNLPLPLAITKALEELK